MQFSRYGWFQVGCFALALLAVACRKPGPKRNLDSTVAPSTTQSSPTAEASAQDADSAQRSLADLRRLFAMSEAGDVFISDNVISNETSLLQPARALVELHGGVYVGVGPEQNYTYIALSRPAFAVIIDLRRDNALLHILYKALFETAVSRLDFLCLLLGRPYDPKFEPAPDAHVQDLLAAVRGIAPTRAWFDNQQTRLDDRIRSFDLNLSVTDIGRLKHMHELFFDRQLDLRFELHKANGRKYPSLEELISLRSPSGFGTFLDNRESFEFVQQLHRQHRIVPIVGDVSAPQPMGAVAEELRRKKLKLRTFYISNVEQYLIGQPSFRGWLRNLRQLPHDEQSTLLRCYLDQGRPHPRQEPGQRSTSLAHRLTSFINATPKQLNRSYFDIVTDEALLVDQTRQFSEDSGTIQ